MLFILFCRHLYFPLRRRGYSQLTATLIVFILSAFFHEARNYNWILSSSFFSYYYKLKQLFDGWKQYLSLL